MNLADVILILAIGAAAAAAVRSIVSGKRRGSCCGDCSSCRSGNCK